MAIASFPLRLSYPVVQEQQIYINEPEQTVVIDGNLVCTQDIIVRARNFVVLGDVTTPCSFSAIVSERTYITGHLNIPMRNIALAGRVTFGYDDDVVARLRALGVEK